MKKALPHLFWLLLPAGLLGQTSAAELDSIWSAYIGKYKDIAMDEMERSGVPASIKLAQGILESRAGTSELAMNANNHFGIKCGKAWRGKTYQKNDDERNKKGERVNSCFRKYDNVAECFADHSAFIRNPEKQHRYGFLFELDPRDYKKWAQGLQDAGYSSVDYYAEKLIFFIERYHLDEYDALAYNGRVALKRLAQVNDVKMIQARDGETLREIATLYNLPVEKLLEYNDGNYESDAPLSIGTWVYLQTKHDSWQGPAVFHRVDTDQRMFDIAQLYGIRLESLLRRNGLRAGLEPEGGALVRLKGQRAPGEQVPVRGGLDALLMETTSDTTLSDGGSADDPGFVIEMLPEEKLLMPVPVSGFDSLESVADTAFDSDLLQPDPVPTVILNMETGKTEIYHTVNRGDTLYSIARRYGISTARLRQINHLKDNVVKIGQSLRVK